jgi:hypothetical protein
MDARSENMSIEAMKQALEALESQRFSKVIEATNALRQAIAEAEKQEPVAWIHKQTGVITTGWSFDKDLFDPLYDHPQPKREPVALRSEQFVDMARAIAPRTVMGMKEPIPNWIVEFGRAVEAAHGIKEKNT